MTSDPELPPQTWPEIKTWRRTRRRALIAERTALDRPRREAIRAALAHRIESAFPWLAQHEIGFYWPIQGEPDLRHLVAGLIEAGAGASLPVVVEKQRPVEFWRWQPGMRMVPGDWNIPQPQTRAPVRPTALLVPLVGFAGFYRLGYGAGYYDRTLAVLSPRPWTIGVGLEQGCLDSIHPQSHDIPLDAIVTESRTDKGVRLLGTPEAPARVRRDPA